MKVKNETLVFIGGCIIALCGLGFFITVMILTDFKSWALTDQFLSRTIIISVSAAAIVGLGMTLVATSIWIGTQNDAYALALETLGGQRQCDLRLSQWVTEIQNRNQRGVANLEEEQRDWDRTVKSLRIAGFKVSPAMLHYLAPPA